VSKFSPFSSVTVTPASYSGYFDGTGDYLSVPSSAATQMGSSNFTTELWVYPKSIATNQCFYVQQDASVSSSASLSYGIYCSTAGTITIVLAASTTRYDFSSTAGIISNINQWYHIALTRNGNVFTLYVNGVSVGTTTAAITLNTNALDYIGLYANPGANDYQYTNGYISNLRIVKGTAVYTSAFTPPTTPLTAISGTSLLTCQSTTFIDNSTNNFAITVNGDAKPVIQNPFTDTVSTASNYSANTFGNSVYFDGTTDYLTTPASSLNQMSGNFTVELWAYPTSIPAQVGLVGINNTASSGGANFGLYLETNRNITFFVAGNATTYSSTNTPITIGAWNHIAFVRSGSTNTVYVNGISVLTNSATPSWSGTPVITVGRLFGDNTGVAFYGYLSNARVVKGQALYTGPFIPSNQPLPSTSNTVLLLASTVGPSTADATRNHNIETFGTARRVANNSPYYDTYSAYFDGTGDYLSTSGAAAANFGTGDFTFETWLYIPIAINANEWDIFEAQPASGAFQLYKAATTSILAYGAYAVSGNQILSSGNIPLNRWFHVAVSRSGSGTNNVSTYVDGVRVAQFTDTTNYSATGITIGGRNTGANYFTGYISNMRAVKGTALYSGTTITVPTSPLTAVANTSLLTCQSNRFIDNSTNAFTLTKAGDAKITAFQPFAANNTSRFSSVYYATKTDYLAVRTQPNLITFPGDFTFECWLYPTDTSLSTAWGIWDSRQNGATAAAMSFGLAALASPVTGSWRLTYYNGTSYYGTGTVLWNQWTHVAWVRSGTTMTFYVNGIAGGTATISGTQTGTATTNPIYIGIKDNGLAGYGTVGYIADFRITNGYARTITVPTAPYDIK